MAGARALSSRTPPPAQSLAAAARAQPANLPTAGRQPSSLPRRARSKNNSSCILVSKQHKACTAAWSVSARESLWKPSHVVQSSVACGASASSELLSEEELRVIWDSMPKTLITIGKKGAQESHGNSLRDLLAAHKVVKVKFFSHELAELHGENLSSMSGGRLLQLKGATVLYAQDALDQDQLLNIGQSNAARKDSRAQHRATVRSQRRMGEPELHPEVETVLRALMTAGKLEVGQLDREALWAMAELPNAEARKDFASQARPGAGRKITNMSAWLTSICRRICKNA